MVAQMVKNLATKPETWVRSLGWEDPLETGLATHSCIPAWRIPGTEEPGGLQPVGLHTVKHNWATSTLLAQAPALEILIYMVSDGVQTSVLFKTMVHQIADTWVWLQTLWFNWFGVLSWLQNLINPPPPAMWF